MRRIEWKELEKHQCYIFKLTEHRELRAILLNIDIDNIEVRIIPWGINRMVPKTEIKEIYLLDMLEV